MTCVLAGFLRIIFESAFLSIFSGRLLVTTPATDHRSLAVSASVARRGFRPLSTAAGPIDDFDTLPLLLSLAAPTPASSPSAAPLSRRSLAVWPRYRRSAPAWGSRRSYVHEMIATQPRPSRAAPLGSTKPRTVDGGSSHKPKRKRQSERKHEQRHRGTTLRP